MEISLNFTLLPAVEEAEADRGGESKGKVDMEVVQLGAFEG